MKIEVVNDNEEEQELEQQPTDRSTSSPSLGFNRKAEAFTFSYFVIVTLADASINIPQENFRYPFFLTRENLFLSLLISGYYLLKQQPKNDADVPSMGVAKRTAFNSALVTTILWAAVLLPTAGLPKNDGEKVLSFLIHAIPPAIWYINSKVKQESITSRGFSAESKYFTPTLIFLCWAASLLGIYSIIDPDDPIYDVLDWHKDPGFAAALTGGALLLGAIMHRVGREIINRNPSACFSRCPSFDLKRLTHFSNQPPSKHSVVIDDDYDAIASLLSSPKSSNESNRRKSRHCLCAIL